MNAAVAAGTALLCAACAAHAGGAPGTPTPAPLGRVTYASGLTRYRSAHHLHVEQQVGGQKQANDAVLVAYLAAGLEPDGDGLRVTFTVDSVPQDLTATPGSAHADAARGTTFAGSLAANGAIARLAPGDSTLPRLGQLGELLRHFYPRIPAGGIVPGSSWTDTTHATRTGSGVPLAVTAVSHHAVGAAIDTLATTALPIHTLTTYTLTGTGSLGGQAFSVAGKGQRSTLGLLSLAGRFLGLTSTDTSSFTVTLPATDLTVPGRQSIADTVSIIR